MEQLETIDILFIVFIVVVVLGGVACLLIFLPKEHDLEDRTSDCYRIRYKNGEYSVTDKKAQLGENLYSVGSQFSYITRLPFTVECFFDDDDGIIPYSAVSALTLQFPEDKLPVFAPTFYGLSQEKIEETLSETASVALGEFVSASAVDGDIMSYDTETLKRGFRRSAENKLGVFGVDVVSVGEIRVKKK